MTKLIQYAEAIVSTWQRLGLAGVLIAPEQKTEILWSALRSDPQYTLRSGSDIWCFVVNLEGYLLRLLDSYIESPAHSWILVGLLQIKADLVDGGYREFTWEKLIVTSAAAKNTNVLAEVLLQATPPLGSDLARIVTAKLIAEMFKYSKEDLERCFTHEVIKNYFRAFGVLQTLTLVLEMHSYSFFKTFKDKLGYLKLSPSEQRKLLRIAMRYENIFCVADLMQSRSVLTYERACNLTTFTRFNNLPMNMTLPPTSRTMLECLGADALMIFNARKHVVLYMLGQQLHAHNILITPSASLVLQTATDFVSAEITKMQEFFKKMHLHAMIVARRQARKFESQCLPAALWRLIFEFVGNDRDAVCEKFTHLDEATYALCESIPSQHVVATAPVLVSADAVGWLFRAAINKVSLHKPREADVVRNPASKRSRAIIDREAEAMHRPHTRLRATMEKF